MADAVGYAGHVAGTQPAAANADDGQLESHAKEVVEDEEGHRENMAKVRVLYKEAPVFLKSLDLKPAEPDFYLALSALVDAYFRSSGEDPESKVAQRLRKTAERALQAAVFDHFGRDLPRVHLPRGSCPQTELRGCPGFGLESADFPSRQMKLEAGEATAARAIRKERRVLEGDLSFRPVAEGGTMEPQENVESGGASSRYLSELLTLACGPELLRLRLYPDAKELTESFAAFHAVRTHLGSTFCPDDPAVTCVCVGDGSLPRTAALFAFRTKWQCYAVDPQMKQPAANWQGIERLEARCAKIEDCNFVAEKLLIVCVHAHVGLAECLQVMDWKQSLGIVVIPCCNFYSRLQLPGPHAPLAEYYDTGVVSPHRLIRVYSQSA